MGKTFTYRISKLLGFKEDQCSDPRPIWVFGEWLGKKYFENSKSLFEYVNRHHPEIRAVWLTREQRILELVRQKEGESYIAYSLKGLWLTWLSQAGFMTHQPRLDLNCLCLLNFSKLVNLYHGIPLKRIALDDKNFFLNKPPFRKPYVWLKKNILTKFSLVIASSEENQRTFHSAFMTPKEKIVITGYPRNDSLFSHSADGLKQHGPSQKKGIYMPTFRSGFDRELSLFEPYGFNASKIDAFLKERQITLHMRLHPFSYPPAHILQQINDAQNIKFFTDEDIYAVLNKFDFLVTDYSSIYFDYLLLDRPIIFSAFDLDDFISIDRGFYYSYADVTPGPKTKNWEGVMSNIQEAIEKPDKYKEDRARVRDMFHKYQDGNSCERVFNEICRLLKEK